MITSLELRDWKSFEQATLHIDPVTVLIGANASGKSNALDALAFLNRIAHGFMLTIALQGDTGMPPLRGGAEWAPRKPGSRFSLQTTIRFDDSTDYEYSVDCEVSDNRCDLVAEQLSRIKFRTDKQGSRKSEAGRIKLFRTDTCVDGSPTIIARLYNEKQGSPRQLGRSHTVLFQLFGQKLRQEIQDGVTVVANALRGIFILDPIPSHMRSYTSLSDNLETDASNIAGVIAALPKDKKDDIEATLTGYASRLPERDICRVYAETVGKFKSDAMLYCEEHWRDVGEQQTIDARGMSDGTLRFLAILTALLTRPTGSLLVVEEIDNGLHPSRAKLMLEMLKDVGVKREVDILVTTHNPALLDAMGTEMVPFISVAHRNPASGFSVLTLLEDINNLPKLLAYGPVGRISSQGIIEKSLEEQLAEDPA